jgi:transposase
LSQVTGHVRNRSQQVEIPPLSPTILEIRCFRCFCPTCGQPNTAPYPEGWDPDQTFGPRLQMAMTYLHHHHHVGCERLGKLLGDLFGLCISPGAVVNALSRVHDALMPEYEAVGQKVRESKVVGSDETRQRVDGQNRWEWTVQSAAAVYHWIAQRRNTQELKQFFGESLPEVQESDCYSAQLASPVAMKQVCHAHQLRDLRYAEEQGDTEYAPRMSRLIRMAIGLCHRREKLRPELFAHQAGRLKRLGHAIGFGPLTGNVFGEAQQRRYRRMEKWWWVFLDRADVNATNNASERALRPSVVHRKVLGGFRSEWGAEAYASFLSVVQTLQREGADLFDSLLGMFKQHNLAPPVAASDA